MATLLRSGAYTRPRPRRARPGFLGPALTPGPADFTLTGSAGSGSVTTGASGQTSNDPYSDTYTDAYNGTGGTALLLTGAVLSTSGPTAVLGLSSGLSSAAVSVSATSGDLGLTPGGTIWELTASAVSHSGGFLPLQG